MALRLAHGNDYFYTDEFRTIVRSCKEILVERSSPVPITDRGRLFAYRHNFHKFLREYGGDALTKISEDMIWVISYINDIEDPTQDFSHLAFVRMVTREDLLAITQSARVVREN